MKSFRGKTLVFAGIFSIMLLFAVWQGYTDYQDDISRNCHPTGEQRMINSTIHASDSAFSALVVQDKWVCDGGAVKWKTPYNDF